MNTPDFPLQRASLRDQLSERLEEMILSGQIAAGDLLPSEREMADQWGVSRTTVRDAMRTLESRGLIRTQHGVGAQVTSDVREAFQGAIELLLQRGAYPRSEQARLRMELEVLAASMAAQARTPADLATLERILEVHADAVEHREFERALDADRTFHIRVIETTHNPLFIDLIAPVVRYFLSQVLYLSPSIYNPPPTLDDTTHHRRVVEALGTGDSLAAQQAMREILRRAMERFQRAENVENQPQEIAGSR